MDILKKFKEKPSYLKMGAGKLSKLWGCTVEDIYNAKKQYREADQEDQPKMIGKQESSNEEVIKYESSKPLSPEEIKELVKVDGYKTKVTKILHRLQANGKWVYSVSIDVANKHFYNDKEFISSLKKIFNSKPTVLPSIKHSDKIAVVLISDDHLGNMNILLPAWTKEQYQQRLSLIVQELMSYPEKFEEVHIVSLGDQLNGWNAQTTRGGHEVKSLSNEEQFDCYVEGRKDFYDKLFTSGVAGKYFVHDLENSNHSGKGFSYMANKCLQYYLSAQYPSVKQISYKEPYGFIKLGINVIGFTHGKDEQFMMRPLPLKLDPKTDLMMYQKFDRKGFSPTKYNLTLYKGDLHSYSMDRGKFGRYINVPSIMGSTDYTELNFGPTPAGALIEIFTRDSKVIKRMEIFYDENPS
jgi:hypothetical protein